MYNSFHLFTDQTHRIITRNRQDKPGLNTYVCASLDFCMHFQIFYTSTMFMELLMLVGL